MLRRASVEDADAIARVHVRGWRSAYRGIVPQAHLDAMDVAEYAQKWRGWLASPASVAYAWEESGRVVGFSIVGPAREPSFGYASELYAVYVDADRQGMGIGRALFDASRAAAAGSMMLWVLEKNPARRFYEKLGGRRLGAREEEVGGARLVEVAYGWPAQGHSRSSPQ